MSFKIGSPNKIKERMNINLNIKIILKKKTYNKALIIFLKKKIMLAYLIYFVRTHTAGSFIMFLQPG